MKGGYQGQTLKVDLSNHKIKKEALDMDLARAFIGGRGLGTKILWDQMKAGEDPLSPESLIMFLTGPLTGLAPGGLHTCLVFKSPLTGKTLGHPISGGNWAPELKFAGYDGVIVKGAADQPVYLYIQDEIVEIRNAQHLWGKSPIETETMLKEEIGDPNLRVMCIGPAAENLVRFTGVHHEYCHTAARGGGGCLMGSKKLKAVAVRGTHGIEVAHPQKFLAAREVLEGRLEAMRKARYGYWLSRWGAAINFSTISDASDLDVKNHREGFWEDIDKLSVLEWEERCRVKSRSCFSCPIACLQAGVIREGVYAGHFVTPKFDSTGTYGSGCLITDLYGVVYLNSLAEDLGFDGESMGIVTSFVMDCFEKGILTRSDLGGLDLRWGNVEAVEGLWHKIAKREGIGEVLSLGVKKAAEKIGQGSERFAMQVKGLEMGGYLAQTSPPRGLQYAVGDRGGCHHYGLDIAEQNFRAWVDSLTICSWHRPFVPRDVYLKVLNGATGWDLQEKDWDVVAERILIMARVYNIREGMRPLEDDILPERAHTEPLTVGPKKGAYYPKEQFLRDRAEWYKERGCDEKGIPTEKHLADLGLKFTVPALKGLSL
jgi:aldehyde:ferredoxin oxidoreductase